MRNYKARPRKKSNYHFYYYPFINMTRHPQTPFVKEKYWDQWFDRIRELLSQTENINNYLSYIYKTIKKEGFEPTYRPRSLCHVDQPNCFPRANQLGTKLRKWITDGKLVHPSKR